jgi:hypothetical protein
VGHGGHDVIGGSLPVVLFHVFLALEKIIELEKPDDQSDKSGNEKQDANGKGNLLSGRHE